RASRLVSSVWASRLVPRKVAYLVKRFPVMGSRPRSNFISQEPSPCWRMCPRDMTVGLLHFSVYLLFRFLPRLLRSRLKNVILCSVQQNSASTCLPVPGPVSNHWPQWRHSMKLTSPESFWQNCHHSALISSSVVILKLTPFMASGTISTSAIHILETLL